MFKVLLPISISLFIVIATPLYAQDNQANRPVKGGFFDEERIKGGFFNKPPENKVPAELEEDTQNIVDQEKKPEENIDPIPSIPPQTSPNALFEKTNQIINSIKTGHQLPTPETYTPPNTEPPTLPSSQINQEINDKPISFDDLRKATAALRGNTWTKSKQSTESNLMIHLVVSASPESLLNINLERLIKLEERLKIPLGEVIIIGSDPDKQTGLFAKGLETILSVPPPKDQLKSIKLPYLRNSTELLKLISTMSLEQLQLVGNPAISKDELEQSKNNPPAVSLDPSTKQFLNLSASLDKEEREQLNQIIETKIKTKLIQSSSVSSIHKNLLKLDLKQHNEIETAQLLDYLQVKSSPVWIVTSGGENHVFEGDYDPIEFFDAYGNFKPKQDN